MRRDERRKGGREKVEGGMRERGGGSGGRGGWGGRGGREGKGRGGGGEGLVMDCLLSKTK